MTTSISVGDLTAIDLNLRITIPSEPKPDQDVIRGQLKGIRHDYDRREASRSTMVAIDALGGTFTLDLPSETKIDILRG